MVFWGWVNECSRLKEKDQKEVEGRSMAKRTKLERVGDIPIGRRS